MECEAHDSCILCFIAVMHSPVEIMQTIQAYGNEKKNVIKKFRDKADCIVQEVDKLVGFQKEAVTNSMIIMNHHFFNLFLTG